ncbi:Glycylpeptide N-tetradecanoyltransferase [Paramicrosporidium saccamoebae]|uniref:Glycylpeptide N-tetradecanoyltransferase n=1 Tax=Paramicrosporidium saccamoebae TaxID=1246581 RepID=A0A2H9THV1_9FUNG|nr:Glycylpeptide N-tetradecanoyltransferase [Paramicrosporidium saccamoebae]
MKLMEQLSRMKATEEPTETAREHKFWTTQPVLKSTASLKDIQDGPIEPLKQIESVRAEPYLLPAEFQWCSVNVHDPVQRDELYQLLNLNYVEDVESLFRFDYPPQFLEWALRAPGWRPEWQIGVRVAETGKLVAFISAVPTALSIRSWDVPSVEVNFLCVHKKLRSKRLAPLLIREITRRVNLEGIFQALYTAGAVLPGVLCKAQYHHRPLNYKKLVEVGFTAVPLGKSIDQMIMRHHLAREHQLGDSIRPMSLADVPMVTTLLSKYLQKFPLHPKFAEHEVAHWLVPREKVIYSYVVENSGEITDFVSFYSLPSTVVDNPLHDRINVAYLFYYATSSSERLVKIVHAALVIAKELDFDVFNCVEIMDNSHFLKDLKFGGGDGCLNYYLYNWQTRPFKTQDVSIVML